MNISFDEIDEFIKFYINHKPNKLNCSSSIKLNPNFNFKEEFKLNFI